MATEEDEYYDSIDDTEFAECRSFCNEKFFEDDSELDDCDCSKINELVPFYNGNVEKSEIDSLRTESKNNSLTTFKGKKLKRRTPLTSLTTHRKNRSYLTLYYARNGKQVKSDDIETTRETCLELSPKSNLSYEDHNSYSKIVNAEEGLYDRFLEKHENESEQHVYETKNGCTKGVSQCESDITLDSKLLSISEAHFNSLVCSRERRTRETPKYKNSRPIKMNTELGGLGPNIFHDKLELLRKRQDYGKTVSEKNRIKIMENKVVKKLKQEIRESNKF